MKLAEVPDAERFAMRQRHVGAKLLRVDQAKASDTDQVLAAKVLDATKFGASDYEEAIGWPGVNDLFRRGVLYFSTKEST